MYVQVRLTSVRQIVRGHISNIANSGIYTKFLTGSDILITCVDGLKGLPSAIESVFPDTEVQLCIVHMVRNSLKFVSYKDRKKMATDLKTIYKAVTVEQAESALTAFGETWDKKYPMVSQSWQSHWDRIIPFFTYLEEIRKVIYTTNAIESLNSAFKNCINFG